MKKVLLIVFSVVLLFTGCMAKESNDPCEWCENIPAYEYKEHTLCKECYQVYKELQKLVKEEDL